MRINTSNLSSAAECYTTTLKTPENQFIHAASQQGGGHSTRSQGERRLLLHFYLISFVVVKFPVIDDRDMFSLANQFKKR